MAPPAKKLRVEEESAQVNSQVSAAGARAAEKPSPKIPPAQPSSASETAVQDAPLITAEDSNAEAVVPPIVPVMALLHTDALKDLSYRKFEEDNH